ncbi:MAG TPA: hypothetical protein VFF74_05950 [Methylophilaceae bacterium]|nr:hypothetical protein [Methylophilaceae bacterium]
MNKTTHYLFKFVVSPLISTIFACAGWFLGGLKLAVILGVTGFVIWLLWTSFLLFKSFDRGYGRVEAECQALIAL